MMFSTGKKFRKIIMIGIFSGTLKIFSNASASSLGLPDGFRALNS